MRPVRRRSLWMAVWLGIGMLGGGRAPVWGQRSEATLISVQGPASVRRSGGGAFVNAVRKMSVAAGDVVRTGPNGRAILLFSDGSQVKLNANTLLLIPSPAGDRRLPAQM